MAAPPGFAEHCAQLLAPHGPVRLKRMFGGHGLYVDELFIALISRQTLYLKADDATREQFRAAGGRIFAPQMPGRGVVELPYWTVPEEALESDAAMAPWARLAIGAALRARAAAAPKRATAGPAPAKGAPAKRAVAKRALEKRPAAKRGAEDRPALPPAGRKRAG
ncbi:regulator of competence-specific genes [Piscinibacter sakaiensis]|uniref:Regulator of competence-specific genes n=1 Tax=Piscinibacter sakaiensis TaxID=1547922 RepID=A0A0K8P4K8_PISS1|nr:regulator of competence-specific genes [Piscinibacter sakaiensis]